MILIEISMTLVIDYNVCVLGVEGKDVSGCYDEGGCMGACPTEALYKNGRLRIKDEECMDCGACLDMCKLEALVLE